VIYRTLLLEEAMRKLRLDPDALTVESFAPQAERDPARGTVEAHENIATGVYSCWNTCRCPSHHNTECCGVI
jgi:hypothetical protein